MEKAYGIYLAYLFQLLIALNGAYAFLIGDYHEMFTAFLMFGLTVVPYVVAKGMRIHFPWFVFFLIALSLWFHTAGYIQGFYVLYYPYYDKIAHLVSGIAVALLGFLGVIFLDRYWKMNLTIPFIVGFTIIFAMALGGFWEIYEFLVDTFFGGPLTSPMQNSLEDTMLDMVFVMVGSVIVALIGVIYFHKHRKEEIMSLLIS
jgi:hypothetical protein